MRSTLKARILFVLLLSQLTFSINANATQTFEQAYAPIDVSGITIFIPIELIPDSAEYLTIKNTNNQSLLEWNALQGATNYILEHKVNGTWIILDDNVQSNSYTASIYDGPEFRVSSCHQYGCSASQSINNWANVVLQIRSFQATDYQISGNDTVEISWDILGASKVQLQSNKGHNYDNLSPRSSKRVSTNDLTTFTLTASGFGSQISQKLSIIKPVPKPEVIIPQSSIYLQPLYDLGLEPIERSLLVGKNNHNYVADLQKKLHRVSDTGQIIWTRDLPGLIANQPAYLTDANGEAFLFFALSKSNLIDTNVAGQFCRLKVDNQDFSCFNLTNNAIAGPTVYIEHGIITSNPRLFLIDVKGLLHEFLPFEKESLQLIGSQQLLQNQSPIRVLTTPQVNPFTKQFIVRTEHNDFLAYPVPTSESFINQSISAISNVFSSEAAQANEQPVQTNAVWSRKLN
ncbi:hypothetical protein A9Q75_08445 [Colwellia psychrerythraea]|uniref:Uncharacterized protein n=1 Tax=Colwellia psychrerythraea TaxID=28229 RepID=A0A1Y5EEM6_COLPS|nr:hypothetical protein A9Q75_08445 [Colwellia psychrerythraea]